MLQMSPSLIIGARDVVATQTADALLTLTVTPLCTHGSEAYSLKLMRNSERPVP